MNRRGNNAAAASAPVNRNIVLAVLVSGAFVVILNQTLLNTALPVFMEEFGITEGAVQWVVTSFMLVNGIMIPITAFLIQKFTTRGLFLTAMGLFIVGTIVCAIAPNYSILLVGRIIQASSGGIIMPLMQTILFAIYPVHKRGAAMGMFGLVISFAPALGPTLSGWIVDRLPWQTLFIMMLPIAVISMVVAAVILRNVTERTFPRLDMLSITLSTFAFGGLLLGFGSAGDAGWLSVQVIVPLVIGAVSLPLFVRRQLKHKQPMLELRVMRDRMFTLNTVLSMFMFIAFSGGMLLVPVYMQKMAGFTAMESGIALLPGAMLMGILSPITGRIYDAVGAKWLAITGFTMLSVSSFFLADLGPNTTLMYLIVVNTVRMVGVAMIMMPTTTAALNQLPMILVPHGTALNNTLRQVAASIGTALLVTVMAVSADNSALDGVAAMIHGTNVAFFVTGVISLLGLFGAFFIKHSPGHGHPQVVTGPITTV